MVPQASETARKTMISIRCLPEEIVYRIQINRLRDGSKVFANMLSCCETSDVGKTEEVIDILESSSDLSLLIELLNDPPKSINRRSAEPQPDSIPFPLMPRIFRLADKYNLSSEIMSALATHLEAHADAHPLRVYGLACQYALPSVADLASKHLLSPPLESYSTDEVAVIPTAEDYHKLLRLQMLRKQRLRQLLEEEDIFPYRYGECWTHVDYTRGRWNEARVSIALGLDAGTDVAQMMKNEADSLINDCAQCCKAWTAATEMLEYKCRKAIHKASQVPRNP